MLSYLKDLCNSANEASSKRFAGLIGWSVCIIIMIYCALSAKEAPTVTDTVLYCSAALLGVDSITGIFKGKAVK